MLHDLARNRKTAKRSRFSFLWRTTTQNCLCEEEEEEEEEEGGGGRGGEERKETEEERRQGFCACF